MAPASMAAAHCDAERIGSYPDAANSQPTATPTGEAHVGQETPPAPTTRAIPRAVRRHVLARDHHTCRIPGCRNTHGIEVHHIVPRAEGGSNRAEYLITICGIHHPAVHGGQLQVSGTADALDVCHADGTPYGGAVSAHRSDTSEKVFRGLRWLGYKERDARVAIQAALREAGENGGALDDAALLRRALAHLG